MEHFLSYLYSITMMLSMSVTFMIFTLELILLHLLAAESCMAACTVLARVTCFSMIVVLSLLQSSLFNHFGNLAELYQPEESNFRTVMVVYDCSVERFLNRKTPVTEGHTLEGVFWSERGVFLFSTLKLRSPIPLSATCCLSQLNH